MKKYRYNTNSIRKSIPKDLLYERAKLIFEYRTKQGWTLERIGKFFGITKERTRQILEDFKNSRKQKSLFDRG